MQLGHLLAEIRASTLHRDTRLTTRHQFNRGLSVCIFDVNCESYSGMDRSQTDGAQIFEGDVFSALLSAYLSFALFPRGEPVLLTLNGCDVTGQDTCYIHHGISLPPSLQLCGPLRQHLHSRAQLLYNCDPHHTGGVTNLES